ncbi:MAG: DUF1588 domain-containing protein [Deltaproteobacteria bacterium]|nr:DUF1588 domain-containing protein [Deltaproteobacteria bacterium]
MTTPTQPGFVSVAAFSVSLVSVASLLVACGEPPVEAGRTTRTAAEADSPADSAGPVDDIAPVDGSADDTTPVDGTGGTGDPTDPAVDDGYADPTDWAGDDLSDEWRARLDAREVNYGAALRTASLRLRGDLPTLVEITMLEGAGDPALVYERLVTSFLEDPRFLRQMRSYYRDTFKMGRGDLESAPLFAASLAATGRSNNEMLTASVGTCPTVEDGVVVPGDCDNGVGTHAGLLTHPAVMHHFASNLAFRRVRWVQETFACSAFPAEHADPVDVGGASPYTAPWPFESIAGEATGGRIDFRDTSSVTCANCHATMNHLAPLFGNFDEAGQLQDTISVTLPLDGAPLVTLSDWLPEGEVTAFRFGVPAADLPALGAAMAVDRDVHRCTVARAWNWALGKGDIVLTRAVVPDSVNEVVVDAYVADGYRMDHLLLDIFTSEDFVRF